MALFFSSTFSVPILSLNSSDTSVPAPFLLVMSIDPSINSMSCFVMLMPSPVPPNLRATVSSSCVNFLNMLFRKSSLIPTPVSLMVTSIFWYASSPSTTVAFSSTEPFSVNFIALLSMLMSTWLILYGSPISFGAMRLSNSCAMISPFSSALWVSILIACAAIFFRSNDMLSIAILPASILDKSSMSLMITSRFSLAALIEER